MSIQVLIVEDSPVLAAALGRGLAEEDFAVETTDRARAALAMCQRTAYDAVILDLGLPDLDGVEVLVTLRARGWLAPVLVLTARDAVDARVAALDAGADDYLVKPFAFDELLARVRALVRRARAPRWAPLSLLDVSLTPEAAHALVAGREVAVSPRERALLEVLLRNQNDVVPREVILREAFGYDFDPGTNLIDVHVSHLRRKLAPSRVAINTVRGVGFVLAPRAREAST